MRGLPIGGVVGQGLAALVLWRSDWAYFVEAFNAKFSYRHNDICHRCKASKLGGDLSFTDFRVESGWSQTARSTADFIRDGLSEFAP